MVVVLQTAVINRNDDWHKLDALLVRLPRLRPKIQMIRTTSCITWETVQLSNNLMGCFLGKFELRNKDRDIYGLPGGRFNAKDKTKGE